MRIGIDATPLLGERTGVGWYTHDLIDALAIESPGDEVLAFPISWRTARALQAPDHPNVRAVRRLAPAKPLWALWDRVPFPPLEAFVRCDVFHATNYIAPPAWRTPTVVTVHDIGFVLRPAEVSAPIARMARLLPRVLDRAAAIIAVSNFTAGELAGWRPSVAGRISVVPNGFHRRAGASAPASGPSRPGGGGEPYALMVGTLEPRKNIPLALDALHILRQRNVKLRLVVAGAGTPRVALAALMAERGLTDSDVEHTGYVDDGRISALMAGASVLAFPSRYEGFGMPLIEAMEAGVPVVASRAGATPETVGDAAILVDPHNAEAFAAAMETAVTDSELRARLVAAGRERAARYTWSKAAAATLAVYRQVAR